MSQKGGDVGRVHLWGQDIGNSYKIQLGIVKIPKQLNIEPQWIDTPYRWRTYHDAANEGRKVFEGYKFRIVSSNDNPHWDSPEYIKNVTTDNLKNIYNVVGIEPKVNYPYFQHPPQLSNDKQYSLNELSKLTTVHKEKLKELIKKQLQQKDKLSKKQTVKKQKINSKSTKKQTVNQRKNKQ